jgi:hypothetical protein
VLLNLIADKARNSLHRKLPLAGEQYGNKKHFPFASVLKRVAVAFFIPFKNFSLQSPYRAEHENSQVATPSVAIEP